MIKDAITDQGSWLFRRRSYILLGFAPLFLVAMMRPEPIEMDFGQNWDNIYEIACVLLAFIGLGIRAFTVGFVPIGTSGRNTRSQVADSLNTTGIYSLTRNPLYLGNAIMYVAIAMFTQDFYVALTMVLFLVIYMERIIATEERFLAEKFGEVYLRWQAETPAFFPRLHGWHTSELPFSVRNMLKREYTGLFLMIAVFFVMDQGREFINERAPIDTGWLIFLIAGATIYIVLRTLKKKTNLLSVPGR